MSGLPIIKFNPKLPKLSKSEQQVLKLLVEAAELITPIYVAQEKQVKKMSDFFHNEENRSEVEQAIKKDPAILSPYTIVEKINGKLVTTPYHIKYAKLLSPIAEKLNEASKKTENKDFSRFLLLQSKALLKGTYEEAIATWLRMRPYILDVSVGPVEHHDDRLFHAKASYQAWVGVVDVEGTKQLNYYKQIVLSTRRKALYPDELFANYHEVRAKVVDVFVFSGHMARTKFVGVNLPMNVKLVEKYGSEVTLFKQANDLRLKEQILSTFTKIFTPSFRERFTTKDLTQGNLRYITLHELAHNDLYYKNAAKNLGDLLSPIYELAATVLGLRMAGSLLLKDVITTKELESMIVAFICRSFYLMEKSKKNKSWFNYAIGGKVFINFMLQTNALKQTKGLAIPDFTKIFISLHDLCSSLEFLLSSGSRKNAADFIKGYSRLNHLD